jgi:hypothetical protein
MSAQPKLGKVLTMPEVAAIAGWDGPRMRRHLLRLNAEAGGKLLHNIGGKGKHARWTVTLANLQRVAPQWFTSPDDAISELKDRVEAVEAEQRRLRKLTTALGVAIESIGDQL